MTNTGSYMMLLTLRLLATSTLLVSLSACGATPVTHDTAKLFITDTHAAPVVFRSLRVDGQTVKGQVRRFSSEPVHFGHIDYAVTNAQGVITEQGRVEHSGGIRARQQRNPSLFRIALQQPLQTGDKVHLTYHIGSHS